MYSIALFKEKEILQRVKFKAEVGKTAGFYLIHSSKQWQLEKQLNALKTHIIKDSEKPCTVCIQIIQTYSEH